MSEMTAMLDSPFGAGFVASLPRDVLGDGDRDIYLVKEVRYADHRGD